VHQIRAVARAVLAILFQIIESRFRCQSFQGVGAKQTEIARVQNVVFTRSVKISPVQSSGQATSLKSFEISLLFLFWRIKCDIRSFPKPSKLARMSLARAVFVTKGDGISPHGVRSQQWAWTRISVEKRKASICSIPMTNMPTATNRSMASSVFRVFSGGDDVCGSAFFTGWRDTFSSNSLALSARQIYPDHV